MESPNGSHPESPQAGGTRSSALSNKLTAVLSSSYADREICSALELLDERKLQNSAAVRRQLRSNIQKEVVDCNKTIIDDFGLVARQLSSLGIAIRNLEKCSVHMRQKMETAHTETRPLMREASTLMAQKEETDLQLKALTAFKKHFLITDSQQVILTASSEPVDDIFFSDLSRVQTIHNDCQILLGGENQALGLEIMEKSSRCLNGAFQKLYKWIQLEFKTLDLESPQISAFIRRALRTLAQRPTLFQSCIDSFAESREHILSDSFYSALTGVNREGQEATGKPIEMFAHDPLRYVGDMLAWTHSTAVSEREALEVLFVSEGDEMRKRIQAGLASDVWSRDEDGQSPFDATKALNDVVNRNLAGVSRLLRQRVEQVVQGHEEPVLAYKIGNLANFYRSTFSKLLGPESKLHDTLDAIEETSTRQFKATMMDSVASLQSELLQVPPDLREPDFLIEALKRLKLLLKDFDTSLTAPEEKEDIFRPVLTEALDPFLEACHTLSKSLKDSKAQIFALNCLLASRDVLTSFDFVDDKASDIQDTIEEQSARLVKFQHAWLLDKSGIRPLMTAIAGLADAHDDPTEIHKLEPFLEDNLENSSRTLDDFLPSALMDAMEILKPLRDQRFARIITQDAVERFCEDFETLEHKMEAADEILRLKDTTDEEQRPPNLTDMYPRTAVEIRVLLS